MFENFITNQILKKLKKFNTQPFDIILVAGQSNAEGYGLGNEELKFKTNESILSLSKQNTFVLADEKEYCFALANKKGHYKEKGNAFSLTFAEKYLENGLLDSQRKLLIVNLAVGGTGFSNKNWGLNDVLFLNLVKKTKLLLNSNKDNEIKCLLWHQGESDSTDNLSYEKYCENLTNLITSFREQTNLTNLPFIAGDMVEEWKPTIPNSFNIEKAIRYVTSTVPNCSFVESTGLLGNTPPDIIHFSRKSCIELGKRYFDAYSKIKK